MANKGMQGLVLEKRDEMVKIRVFRNNTCEDCDCVLKDACDPDTPPKGRRGMFDLFADRSTLELEATNLADADVGDRIVVKIKDDMSIVKGSFLMYLLPGILFLMGLFGGGLIAQQYWGATGDQEILAQLGGGVLMLLLSYAGTKLYLLSKGTGEYIPRVTEVLKRAEPPDQMIHSASS